MNEIADSVDETSSLNVEHDRVVNDLAQINKDNTPSVVIKNEPVPTDTVVYVPPKNGNPEDESALEKVEFLKDTTTSSNAAIKEDAMVNVENVVDTPLTNVKYEESFRESGDQGNEEGEEDQLEDEAKENVEDETLNKVIEINAQ